MDTYTLPHFPAPYSRIYISIFQNVTNSFTIRKRLIEAASLPETSEGERVRDELDFAFLEGRLIASRLHLITAIQTTLLNCLAPTTEGSNPTQPQTKSHNLHSELLLTLSPNNNISDSVRRHGLSDKTDVLIVVRIGGVEGDEKTVFESMSGLVDGDLGVLEVLDQREEVDWDRLDKIYKLSEISRLPLSSEEIRQKKIAAIINTIAIKSVS